MSKTTRATQALTRLGVPFTLQAYDYDPGADSIGLQAAQALGIEASPLLKTLMAEVDGKPVCVCLQIELKPDDARETMVRALTV